MANDNVLSSCWWDNGASCFIFSSTYTLRHLLYKLYSKTEANTAKQLIWAFWKLNLLSSRKLRWHLNSLWSQSICVFSSKHAADLFNELKTLFNECNDVSMFKKRVRLKTRQDHTSCFECSLTPWSTLH